MAEGLKMEIIKECAVLKETPSGFKKALRIIAWNGNSPKLDLREWTSKGYSTAQGFTMTDEEAKILLEGLTEYFNEKAAD